MLRAAGSESELALRPDGFEVPFFGDSGEKPRAWTSAQIRRTWWRP